MNQAFSFASSPVDYYREGELLASQVPAKLGRTVFRYENPAGVTVRTEQRDFILRASDIPSLSSPRTGDEIVLSGEVFVVCAPNGEPCWRWHSRLSRTEIRIHAKSAGPVPSSSSSSSGCPYCPPWKKD